LSDDSCPTMSMTSSDSGNNKYAESTPTKGRITAFARGEFIRALAPSRARAARRELRASALARRAGCHLLRRRRAQRPSSRRGPTAPDPAHQPTVPDRGRAISPSRTAPHRAAPRRAAPRRRFRRALHLARSSGAGARSGRAQRYLSPSPADADLSEKLW